MRACVSISSRVSVRVQLSPRFSVGSSLTAQQEGFSPVPAAEAGWSLFRYANRSLKAAVSRRSDRFAQRRYRVDQDFHSETEFGDFHGSQRHLEDSFPFQMCSCAALLCFTCDPEQRFLLASSLHFPGFCTHAAKYQPHFDISRFASHLSHPSVRSCYIFFNLPLYHLTCNTLVHIFLQKTIERSSCQFD